MANEIMFPIQKTPSFEDLLEIIVEGFEEHSISTRQLTVGLSAKKGLELSDKFVSIQDHQYGYFCWITFNYFEPEFREKKDMDFPIMVGIKTRGESKLKFSILIAYILAKALNARIIYDDAYLVQQKEAYPVNELKPFVDKYVKALYSISE
jgi:hypothetical protein